MAKGAELTEKQVELEASLSEGESIRGALFSEYEEKSRRQMTNFDEKKMELEKLREDTLAWAARQKSLESDLKAEEEVRDQLIQELDAKIVARKRELDILGFKMDEEREQKAKELAEITRQKEQELEDKINTLDLNRRNLEADKIVLDTDLKQHTEKNRKLEEVIRSLLEEVVTLQTKKGELERELSTLEVDKEVAEISLEGQKMELQIVNDDIATLTEKHSSLEFAYVQEDEVFSEAMAERKKELETRTEAWDEAERRRLANM